VQGSTNITELRLVTPDQESSMNPAWWLKKGFEQICSRESLKAKAAIIEKTIFVTEHQRERHDFDPRTFYENRF